MATRTTNSWISSSVANLENEETNFNLQLNRSRSLLGVRSSDWYQTKAVGLYFFFVRIFFVFRKFSVSKVWKDNLTLDQILDHLQTSSPRIRLARAVPPINYEQKISKYRICELLPKFVPRGCLSA